jgi:hypothetical protein
METPLGVECAWPHESKERARGERLWLLLVGMLLVVGAGVLATGAGS